MTTDTSTDFPLRPQTSGFPGLPFLLGAVAVLTALRIAALWISPLELVFDEAQYWSWSRDLTFGYFTKPPLIAWAIAGTTAVCGDSAACVRSLSPLCHAVTAVLVYVAALKLYGRRTALVAGFTWITMPGVAVSSFLMTTDTLLLMFWSIALVALVLYRERPSLGLAVVFGLAVGFGLNAKYAMIYLPPLVAVAAIADPALRRALRPAHVLVALAIGFGMIAPNLLWNVSHGFVTVTHTGHNMGWTLHSLNPKDGVEYFFAQFAVAGPIIFATMVLAVFGLRRSDRPETDRMLLWLSWPIVIMITIQGFLAHANANWGATAFPAGVVFAAAVLALGRYRFWLKLHVAISLLVTAVILGFTALGPPPVDSELTKSFRQLRGWQQTADNLAEVHEREGTKRIVTFGRSLTAGMIYALRETDIPVLALRMQGAQPFDHFQMDRPWYPDGDRDGTLLFGPPAEMAEALGARKVADIDAPLYFNGGGSMPVFSFDP